MTPNPGPTMPAWLWLLLLGFAVAINQPINAGRKVRAAVRSWRKP